MSARRFPFIDPVVEHVSVSALRAYNNKALRELDRPVLIHTRERGPAAVLLSYRTYMAMQKIITDGFGPILEQMLGKGE